MPTSRSEKEDMFTTYNSSTYKSYNNCYTYALGYYVNPVTGSKFRWNGQNPGEMSGNAISMEDLVDADTAKAAIETALTADCNYFGGDWAEITSSAQPRAGYYKVALVLDPEDDYHWYRQLPNGQWGHKPGTTTAKNTDCSNYIIYYPNSCDRDGSGDGAPNYTEFLGWYEIKTPTSATATASSDVQDGTLEVTYPVKYNLTMDMIKELTRATSYEVAMTILGDAHRYYGSGTTGEPIDTNCNGNNTKQEKQRPNIAGDNRESSDTSICESLERIKREYETLVSTTEIRDSLDFYETIVQLCAKYDLNPYAKPKQIKQETRSCENSEILDEIIGYISENAPCQQRRYLRFLKIIHGLLYIAPVVVLILGIIFNGKHIHISFS